MIRVFADTFYFFALINPKDIAHLPALEFSEARDISLVTTSWVLTELADGLSRSGSREIFAMVLDDFRTNPPDIIVPASQVLFDEGVSLYNDRPDKNWSLTDCISFVVMHEHGLTDALTGDHHFEQAGFNILLG